MRSLFDYILRSPSYGYEVDGKMYFPTKEEHRREIFQRLNVFANHKNWISLFSVLMTALLIVPMLIFVFFYFKVSILLLALCYTMIIKNIHCTAYLHRFASHHSFKIRNKFWLFLFRNATVKVIPEEIYAVSHLVHHAKCEKPGDPYNVYGGSAYCFFAEITHNPIALDLNEEDYNKTKRLIAHTGMRLNSYKEYQKWGSISHPLYLSLTYLLNWAFWFTAFYFIFGDIAYPLAFLGMSAFWAISIRNFNFKGHGSGENRHKEGRDYYTKDLSVNIPMAGMLAGEWHNNHHFFPSSARNDFLKGQPDFTFNVIQLFHKLGIVTDYIDRKEDFLNKIKKRGKNEI